MTRAAFLARLREGLRGLPPQTINEAIVDYDMHFTDGVSDGRSEEDIARGLGDPGRLARELRAEIGLKRWEEQKTPSGAASAIFAVLGLGAIDILILLPILLAVLSALFGFFVAAIAVFFAGGFVFAGGPFLNPPGGPLAAILGGIGLMAGGASWLAILTLISVGLVNLLVWYGRLHYRLLKPAIEPQAQGAVP
jgi:uncharacterized membrane protein